MAVQLLEAINIGVPKKAQQEDEPDDDAKEEEKFESRYLDSGLMKEKRAVNTDANRLMKMLLTDGRN